MMLVECERRSLGAIYLATIPQSNNVPVIDRARRRAVIVCNVPCNVWRPFLSLTTEAEAFLFGQHSLPRFPASWQGWYSAIFNWVIDNCVLDGPGMRLLALLGLGATCDCRTLNKELSH
jgi:hypothetical protein